VTFVVAALSVGSSKGGDVDELQAVQQLEHSGAEVSRDKTLPDRPVKIVYFPGDARFGGQEVRLLRALSGLKVLILRCKITDTDVKGISEVKQLKELDLSFAEITDIGLKDISQLKGLARLSVANTRITDAGLKEIARLENLTYLNLTSTRITDEGMLEVRNLRNLASLKLSDTRITDAGIKALKGLKHLELLYVNQTGVTSGGIRELEKDIPTLRVNP
jgi:Leucine-rich repeat (LRR) protein